MNIIEKINLISEKSKNQFKPDLKKYGKNFRAISESALLETLNPLFKEYNIAYQILIDKSDLRIEKINCGRDLNNNLIQKLVFIAEVKVKLILVNPEQMNFEHPDKVETFVIDGYGMGIDAGDKATGKAYTSAVKYALLKGLRLQYSDDPDAEVSEDIEDIIEETVPAPVEKKKSSKKEEKKDEPLASEGQLNYIRGLAIACGLSDDDFKEKYKYFPYDEKIPMRKAREIIEELKKLQDEKLPF